MMHQRQFDIINYIDDILGINVPSKIDASFDTLRHLLYALGFEISVKKLEKLNTRLNCLGVIVHTKKFTLSIPPKNARKYWKYIALGVIGPTSISVRKFAIH